MTGTKQPLFDLKGPLVTPLSVFWLAARLIERRQIIQAHRHVVTPRAAIALEDGKGAQVEPFGLFVLALPIEDSRQRGFIRRHIWVIRPKSALAHFESAARERLAVGEAAARVLKPAEV